jgi:hypothetical protein
MGNQRDVGTMVARKVAEQAFDERWVFEEGRALEQRRGSEEGRGSGQASVGQARAREVGARGVWVVRGRGSWLFRARLIGPRT